MLRKSHFQSIWTSFKTFSQLEWSYFEQDRRLSFSGSCDHLHLNFSRLRGRFLNLWEDVLSEHEVKRHKTLRNWYTCRMTALFCSLALSLSAWPVWLPSWRNPPCAQLCQRDGLAWGADRGRGLQYKYPQKKTTGSLIIFTITKLLQLLFPPGDFYHNHMSPLDQHTVYKSK